MKNLTISMRLIILIACSVIGLLVVGLIGYSAAMDAERGVNQIRDDSLVSIKTIGEARAAFQSIRINVYAHAMNTEVTGMEATEKRIHELEKIVNESLKKYEKLVSSEDDKSFLAAEQRDFLTYKSIFQEKMLPKSRGRDTQGAMQVMREELRPLALVIQKSFDNHVLFNESMADRYAKQLSEATATKKKETVGVIIVAVLLIAGIGIMMYSNIRASLSHIQDKVTQVESTLDFTQRVAITRRDEIGLTADTLNRLLDKMQDSLKTIMVRTENVAHSANELATTSKQVAIASQHQSESASTMAATVEEMTVSISHVGDQAQEANRISTESGRLAGSGEAIIGDTVRDIHQISNTVQQAATKIRELEAQGEQIANVVAVIKEVADQTNLLALNAAIEAARAGEQGRGFAVVADEVRKLAERTASSTHEIAATIEAMRSGATDAVASMTLIVGEVSNGVESAQKASEAIGQIGAGSRATVEMVEEISSAIREQASAMTGIAQQVERVAQMSEENNAAAENSAQVATDLNQLASEMKQIVDAYRL